MNIREEYEEKTQVKLNKLNTEIDKLKAKLEKVEADEKINYTEEIEKLSIMRDEFSENLTKLKDAGNTAWEVVKSDIEKLSASVEGTLRSVISKFK